MLLFSLPSHYLAHILFSVHFSKLTIYPLPFLYFYFFQDAYIYVIFPSFFSISCSLLLIYVIIHVVIFIKFLDFPFVVLFLPRVIIFVSTHFRGALLILWLLNHSRQVAKIFYRPYLVWIQCVWAIRHILDLEEAIVPVKILTF